jgi:hypothetical protein
MNGTFISLCFSILTSDNNVFSFPFKETRMLYFFNLTSANSRRGRRPSLGRSSSAGERQRRERSSFSHLSKVFCYRGGPCGRALGRRNNLRKGKTSFFSEHLFKETDFEPNERKHNRKFNKIDLTIN